MTQHSAKLALIALLMGTAPTVPASAYQPPSANRPMPPGGRPQVMPVQPNRPGFQSGFAGRIRCESRNNNRRRCLARTQNRAVLIRQIGGRSCREGRDWFFDRNSITVTGGCRGEFAFGFGSFSGYPYGRDRGSSVGGVIAGVAVAGGLMALLASNRNQSAGGNSQSAPAEQIIPFPPGPPAAIDVDFSAFPAGARPAVQTCMLEAARQVGVTGGTRLRHESIVSVEPGNGGWRIRAHLVGTFPDGDRRLPIFCRATAAEVIELTFG